MRMGSVQFVGPLRWIFLILGVLTKPDMVGEGDEAPLLQHLEEPERGYGYYVVKRPATKHLQLTPEMAQQKEDEFFTKNIPWCQVNERRRGVKRVADVLSTLLMQRIRERYLLALSL